MAYGFKKHALLVHHKIKNYQPTIDKWNLIRQIASNKVSPKAMIKLEWIIFYHTVAQQNARLTASHFDISRKTLHKWLNRFDSKNIHSLEETTRRPHQLRTWQVSDLEEERIIRLRKQYIRWGKQVWINYIYLEDRTGNQEVSVVL